MVACEEKNELTPMEIASKRNKKDETKRKRFDFALCVLHCASLGFLLFSCSFFFFVQELSLPEPVFFAFSQGFGRGLWCRGRVSCSALQPHYYQVEGSSQKYNRANILPVDPKTETEVPDRPVFNPAFHGRTSKTIVRRAVRKHSYKIDTTPKVREPSKREKRPNKDICKDHYT